MSELVLEEEEDSLELTEESAELDAEEDVSELVLEEDSEEAEEDEPEDGSGASITVRTYPSGRMRIGGSWFGLYVKEMWRSGCSQT